MGRRWLRVVVAVGPYVASALVLWRMASWEQALAKWVAHGQQVLDAAAADLGSKATELHEEEVARGARRN